MDIDCNLEKRNGHVCDGTTVENIASQGTVGIGMRIFL
jgi:hypothetical protein